MVVRSDWRSGPSAVERSAPATTAAMSAAAETLRSHLELVLDERVGVLNADQRRFLDVALRYGERLVRLVEDMRTVALAEAGELEVTWSRFDLVETARWAVEQVWPVARVEGKPIELRHGGRVDIDADERRVARALVGLLSDVLDAVEPGTVVTVSAAERGLEIAYGGEKLPADGSLALAEAIARLHGGEFVVSVGERTVSLALSLEASASLSAVA